MEHREIYVRLQYRSPMKSTTLYVYGTIDISTFIFKYILKQSQFKQFVLKQCNAMLTSQIQIFYFIFLYKSIQVYFSYSFITIN